MTRRHRHWALLTAVAVAMGLTTLLYARPETAILLAEQLWACFGV